MIYNLNQIFKALDKLFKAGFTDEKSISNMKIEDLLKLKNLTNIEISIIIEFKKAIKEKNLVAFLTYSYKEREDDNYA